MQDSGWYTESLSKFQFPFQVAFFLASFNKFNISESGQKRENSIFFFFHSTMQDERNQVKALKRTLGLVVTN